jgi:hypothetical protein
MGEKCTVTSTKITEGSKILGFQFKIHIPENLVYKSANYRGSWLDRNASTPAINKEFTILFPDESKWATKFLESFSSEEHAQLLATEILAQKIFTQELSIDYKKRRLKLIIQTLLLHVMRHKTWFHNQPPWFHFENNDKIYSNNQIFCCYNTHCDAFGQHISNNDPFCSRCGHKRELFSTPILKEVIFTCISKNCKLYKKDFNTNHKQCHECGQKLDLFEKNSI